MRSVEMAAKNREEAIKKALEQLGAERHEVKVEVLDEGSAGFLGIGARDVRVRVTLDRDRGGEDQECEAAALLQEMIVRMGLTATVKCETTEEGDLHLVVESPDSAILIGRKGRNLSAMQYLINRMVLPETETNEGRRIVVDVEGYLDRRRTSLEDMAQRLAQRVKETGRRVRVKPLSPQERRIIHMTLQDDPDVKTFSVGESTIRSVIIAPRDEDTAENRRRDPVRNSAQGHPHDAAGRGQGTTYGRSGRSRGTARLHRAERRPRSARTGRQRAR